MGMLNFYVLMSLASGFVLGSTITMMILALTGALKTTTFLDSNLFNSREEKRDWIIRMKRNFDTLDVDRI